MEPDTDHRVPGLLDAAAERVRFDILSFEGPDPYCRAGGISSRISGLSRTLADLGCETHLWFVGDPELPGHEESAGLHLHRWCQWISRYHPGGVYDGEEGKRSDFASSLPPHLVASGLLDHLRRDGVSVVLAEEWHTVDALLHLDWLLRREGLRDRVRILWNANNAFGFHRIAWDGLSAAATITTVSRFMKHQMWSCGVDPIVTPNGLSADAFLPPDRQAVSEVRHRTRGRTLLAKVARWDPDKRWLHAIHIVAAMKRAGFRPLLVARGGVERHAAEVFREAAACGLRVVERGGPAGSRGLAEALDGSNGADVLSLLSPLDGEGRRTLFRAADTVLAQSGREPFGLVGLEAMAVAGLACTGCTGEDYAVEGKNAIVLQTSEPGEFVGFFREIAGDPARERAMRQSARMTAKAYSWPQVIRRSLLPRLSLLAA